MSDDKFNYQRAEFDRVLDAGPHDDEDWYRLQIKGKAETKHLNVTDEQVRAIGRLLAGDTKAQFVVIGHHAWGTGDTVAEAKENFRGAGGRLPQGYMLMFCNGITSVFDGIDSFGRMTWYGERPVEIEKKGLK